MEAAFLEELFVKGGDLVLTRADADVMRAAALSFEGGGPCRASRRCP